MSIGEGRASAADHLDPRTALLQRQKAAWTDVSALREDIFRLLSDFAGDDLTGLENRVSLAAKLFTIVDKDARALLMAQEAERRTHGFDDKQQQQATVDDEVARRRRRELAASIVKMATMPRGSFMRQNRGPTSCSVKCSLFQPSAHSFVAAD